MSVSVTFYKHKKRDNSTSVPTTSVLAASCMFKEEVSLLRPSFILQYGQAVLPSFNYCYYGGRYYRVTDVKNIRNNVWQIDAEVDVLATYKAEIAATFAYVVYTARQNTQIVDTRLPIMTTPVVDYRNANVPHLSQTGTYLLSVVGAAPSGSNGTKGPRTYALSAGALATVLQSVSEYIEDIGAQSTDTMDAILAIGRQLVGAGSVPENIRGCMWVPWDIVGMDSSTVSNEKIWLGLFDASEGRAPLEVAGYAIDKPVVSFTVSVAIPWQFADWRRNSPYTQVYLYIPFIGLVQLSSENLAASDTIDVTIAINRLTGNMDVQVKASGESLGTYSASTGIGIPVGAGGAPSAYAAVGALAHGASMAAGALPNGAAASAVLGTVAEASHIAPNTITAGNLSGGAGIGLDLVVSCYTVSHDTAVNPHSVTAAIGEPYNQAVILGSLSGYIQCAGASCEGSSVATSAEKEMINAYLNSGFFYE